MLEMKKDRLRVKIATPGEEPNRYCRFDRAGFVTSICLDGEHEFCAAEPTNLVHPSSGGQGLCNEFIFPEPCSEANLGEFFPKFGIGMLKKTDNEPFCFFRQYEMQPFPLTWTQEENSITFYTEPVPCIGYALLQKKTLTLTGCTLTMNVMIANMGQRPVTMREYCHNFLTIDKLPLGPNYELRMPGIKEFGPEILNGTFCGKGKGFSFTDYNKKATLISIPEVDIENCESFEWSMYNSGSSASVTIAENFRPCALDIWAIDHIISVETFHKIALLPGETDNWQRSWTFEC